MYYRFIFAALYFGVATAVRPLPHDDLIVAVDGYIEFSNKTGYTKIVLNDYHNGVPTGLAYDPSSQTLYFSDQDHEDIHIFSTTLSGTDLESNHQLHHVLQKHGNQSAENLSFDPVDSSLFWVDTTHSSINRIQMKAEMSNSTENPGTEMIHSLSQDFPRGLITDPCTRMMYWSNWDLKHPTIERSYMNGSHREIIIEKDLCMPHGLALDIKEQKLYWVSNGKHFNSFHIERSYVDGSEREIVYDGVNHYAYYLTVSEDYIYWTDWQEDALWSMRKKGSGNQPTLLRRYNERPMAVILFNQQPLNCEVMTQISHHKETPYIHVGPTSAEHPITDVANTEPAVSYEKADEILESQNIIDSVVLCKGYCFNGGQCHLTQITNQLICKCSDQFSGIRCEKKGNFLSGPAAAAVAAAAATSDNTVAWAVHNISSLSEIKRKLSSALICIAVTCGALIVVVIGLSIRVYQLSRRPRIRRRFFGPVKSGKLGKSDPATGPVMDIENCCNMNICETPCTEPPNRTPKADRKGHGDNQRLLGGCQF